MHFSEMRTFSCQMEKNSLNGNSLNILFTTKKLQKKGKFAENQKKITIISQRDNSVLSFEHR